jgi:hypothetical protein
MEADAISNEERNSRMTNLYFVEILFPHKKVLF